MDAIKISENHLNICRENQTDLGKTYSDLIKEKQSLISQNQIVEKDIEDLLLPTSKAANVTKTNSLTKEVENLEAIVIKFKISKAEQAEKLDTLYDTIDLYKSEINKIKYKIESLNQDIKKYTEYKKIIQKSINRQSLSLNSSVLSQNSSFYQSSSRADINSVGTGRNSSQKSNRSINFSVIID